jgi:hypothetical protein
MVKWRQATGTPKEPEACLRVKINKNMKEKLTKEDVGFAQIKNDVLTDGNLSLKAKGLFAYLYSKPDDWDFSGDRMADENLDGRKSIYSALKELEKSGYLIRTKRPDGRVDYQISHSKKPNVQKGQQAKINEKTYSPKRSTGQQEKTAETSPTAQRGQLGSISNTELNITNKEFALTEKTERFINELKESMQGLTLNKIQIEEIKKFVSYWTEPNKSKTKIKWELEKTWDMKRRVGTWMRNSVKFNKSNEPKGIRI